MKFKHVTTRLFRYIIQKTQYLLQTIKEINNVNRAISDYCYATINLFIIASETINAAFPFLRFYISEQKLILVARVYRMSLFQ